MTVLNDREHVARRQEQLELEGEREQFILQEAKAVTAPEGDLE
jgi:hypothetical protein